VEDFSPTPRTGSGEYDISGTTISGAGCWSCAALHDAGQAAAHLTFQARAMGLHAHQFAGFDHDALAEAEWAFTGRFGEDPVRDGLADSQA